MTPAARGLMSAQRRRNPEAMSIDRSTRISAPRQAAEQQLY
ncbi:hypothetical protein SGL43_02022 [Streptomyces globisporus]|uniref:Uncharacterized protein n=1 Tax=Streptomyces globisporus TaxID=1908 RepID=A0ABM9GU42_STRGL|nr:hypothetical protein SGL43_02022 [Streptomyces globisporus]